MDPRIQLWQVSDGVGERFLLGDRGHRLPEASGEHRTQRRLGQAEPDDDRCPGLPSGAHQPVDDRGVQVQVPQLAREHRRQRRRPGPAGVRAGEGLPDHRHGGTVPVGVQPHQRVEEVRLPRGRWC